MIGLADVQAAARRLDGLAHRTPVFTSRTLDARAGGAVALKAENLQRGGAFKFRGAYNHISSLDDGERARGVVTASSGNHAQAVALAAGLCGTSALVLMPDDAPAAKREATDAEIVDAMVFLFERCKLVAEPSGACALAGLLSGRIGGGWKRAGVVISGGNVGRERFAELLGGVAIAEGG